MLKQMVRQMVDVPEAKAKLQRWPMMKQTVQVQKERLANGYKTLAAHSAVTKGAVKQAEIARQRREIKDLIQRLEAGEQVAPGEVDRVLQAH